METKQTTKIQLGYTYVTEEEYNKIKTENTKSNLRFKDESALSFMSRIGKKVNEKLQEIEKRRDEEAYKRFIESK